MPHNLAEQVHDEPQPLSIRRVVINACHGGFSLSRAAFLKLRERGVVYALEEADVGEYYSDGSGPRESWGGDAFCREAPRDDAALIAIIEEMGDAADGMCAALRVVEIPADVEWTIEEYDGSEWVAEKHRTWP